MKKTIIAASIAAVVAAPAAFADVSIYGNMHMDINDGVLSDKGSTLGFKGSEDLGNGMTAVFDTQMKYTNLATDIAGTEGAFDHNGKKTYVGLSGDFGKVLLGRQYGPTKGFVGKMEIAGDTIADNGSYDAAEPFNSGVSYSNSFGGVTVNALAYGTEVGDETDIGISTKIGGATVGVSQDSTEDTTSVYASMTMDALTVSAMMQDGDTKESQFLTASYKMGANSISVARYELDNNGTETDTTNIVLSHAFSKATNVYFASESAGDTTSVGLRHKF